MGPFSPFGSFWNYLDALNYDAGRILQNSTPSGHGPCPLEAWEVAMNDICPVGRGNRIWRWRLVPSISMSSSSGLSRGSTNILVEAAQRPVSSATADPRGKPEDDDIDERSLQLATAGSCLVPLPCPVGRRHSNSPTLRSIIATWSELKRFRWALEQMLKDNPHLIDDIGLTRRQVEAEIAKSFWQA
jgi:uncharacterized protein YjiS (DUF1127 family)